MLNHVITHNITPLSILSHCSLSRKVEPTLVFIHNIYRDRYRYLSGYSYFCSDHFRWVISRKKIRVFISIIIKRERFHGLRRKLAKRILAGMFRRFLFYDFWFLFSSPPHVCVCFLLKLSFPLPFFPFPFKIFPSGPQVRWCKNSSPLC